MRQPKRKLFGAASVLPYKVIARPTHIDAEPNSHDYRHSYTDLYCNAGCNLHAHGNAYRNGRSGAFAMAPSCSVAKPGR